MGVTRASVISVARDLGFSVVEKLISVNELLTADEAFFSGTYTEIAPIREIGHYRFGDGKPGRVTRDVQDVFYRLVRGEESRYRSWLHPVAPVARPVARAARRATTA